MGNPHVSHNTLCSYGKTQVALFLTNNNTAITVCDRMMTLLELTAALYGFIYFFIAIFLCSVWDVRFHPIYSNNLFTCAQDGSLWHWDASFNNASSLMAPTTSTALSQLAPPRSSSTLRLGSHPPSSTASTGSGLLSRGSAGLPPTSLLGNVNLAAATTDSATRYPQRQLPTSTSGSTPADETSGGGSLGGTSPWLSGAIQQGKVEIVNLIPDNCLSVNSLDIESRHLVCGTDGEALFVIPNLTLT